MEAFTTISNFSKEIIDTNLHSAAECEEDIQEQTANCKFDLDSLSATVKVASEGTLTAKTVSSY